MSKDNATAEWGRDGSIAPKPPEGLRESAFRDEQGKDVYHLAIPVKGGTVFAREMDDETFAKFQQEQAPLQALQEKAVRIEEEAEELEAKGKIQESLALRAGMMDEMRGMEKKNREVTKWLCEILLAGWSFPREFSPQSFAQMCGDTQQSVINEIVRASLTNRDDSRFLAEGSLTS